MESEEWPFTDECFADTRTAQGAFDQIKNPATGLVDADCFMWIFWAVETGDWSYFLETETDEDGDGDDDNTPVDVCTLDTAEAFIDHYATVGSGDATNAEGFLDDMSIMSFHHDFCDCHYWFNATTSTGTADTASTALMQLCEYTDCPTLLDKLDCDGDGKVSVDELNDKFIEAW